MSKLKYKVGDRVRIKSLDWYNENKDKYGTIYTSNGFCFCDDMTKHCGDIMKIIDIIVDPKDSNQGYYIMDNVKKWTDEMIECKVGEEIKPKFKVGDILFYRGETSGYLKVEEIRVENGEIRYYENSRNVYLVENDPDVFADKVCSVEIEKTKSEDELLDNYEELTDRAFKGGYEKCKSDIELNGFQLPEGYQFVDENGNIINTQKIILEKKPDDKLKLESTKKVREYWSEYARIFIEIYDNEPNECVLTHLYTLEGHRQKGYGKQALIEAESIAKELGCHTAYLKVETNSWMHEWYLRMGYKWYRTADEGYTWLAKNLTSMEKKKKEYPKTYRECCDILDCYSYNVGFDKCESSPEEVLHDVLLAFRKLIICRDAYWKIAGEEMGLGKPWEPDWENKEEEKYTIEYFAGMVHKDHYSSCSRPFAFPTAEMRDAFYEAFKEEIKICKEFL